MVKEPSSVSLQSYRAICRPVASPKACLKYPFHSVQPYISNSKSESRLCVVVGDLLTVQKVSNKNVLAGIPFFQSSLWCALTQFAVGSVWKLAFEQRERIILRDRSDRSYRSWCFSDVRPHAFGICCLRLQFSNSDVHLEYTSTLLISCFDIPLLPEC
jgi:hypothetical protein